MATLAQARAVAQPFVGKEPVTIKRGPDGHQLEHDHLFEAIRTGTPLNEADYGATSTLTAVMGRMATYTGQVVTWDEAWNSEEDLTPPAYEFGPLPVPPVAIPGVTKFR